jgi:hypothetical protein
VRRVERASKEAYFWRRRHRHVASVERAIAELPALTKKGQN